MARTYEFSKLGGRFICSNASFLDLFWYLIIKNNSLRLSHIKLGKRTSLGVFIAFVINSFVKNKNVDTIYLPIFGHMCLYVHRGIKIFNFRSKTVTKVLDKNTSKSWIKREINSVKIASKLNFAPNIINTNNIEAWYEEEYLTGDAVAISHITNGASVFMKHFYDNIMPCLTGMATLHLPEEQKLHSYVYQIQKTIETNLDNCAELEKTRVNAVNQYIGEIVNKLANSNNISVQLFFSHGDFCTGNTLVSNNKFMVIDWEGAANRCILNDFYNYFMTELYYKRANTDFVFETQDALIQYKLHLKNTSKDINFDIDNLLNIYRWLYYIERMLVMAERDLNEKIMNVIMNSIDIFRQFETDLSSKEKSQKVQ